MMWAQIINGRAVNPVTVDPADCYAAEWLAEQPPFVEVPDGTLHGAVDNGDGTFTNPVEASKPRILSKTAFQDYAVTQLGGGLTGMGRFTEIMDATRNSSAGAVRFAYSRYEAANTFEKENTSQLTAVMAADTTEGHLTEQERTAILDNWP